MDKIWDFVRLKFIIVLFLARWLIHTSLLDIDTVLRSRWYNFKIDKNNFEVSRKADSSTAPIRLSDIVCILPVVYMRAIPKISMAFVPYLFSTKRFPYVLSLANTGSSRSVSFHGNTSFRPADQNVEIPPDPKSLSNNLDEDVSKVSRSPVAFFFLCKYSSFLKDSNIQKYY